MGICRLYVFLHSTYMSAFPLSIFRGTLKGFSVHSWNWCLLPSPFLHPFRENLALWAHISRKKEWVAVLWGNAEFFLKKVAYLDLWPDGWHDCYRRHPVACKNSLCAIVPLIFYVSLDYYQVEGNNSAFWGIQEHFIRFCRNHFNCLNLSDFCKCNFSCRYFSWAEFCF